jgi:hypothetical protein
LINIFIFFKLKILCYRKVFKLYAVFPGFISETSYKIKVFAYYTLLLTTVVAVVSGMEKYKHYFPKYMGNVKKIKTKIK